MLCTFETERLLFRPFEQDDLEELCRLYSDAEVMKFVAPVRDIEQTRLRLKKHIRDRYKYGFGLFAAILKSSGVFVGRCGLDPEIIDGELQGEIAWMFSPEYWGNGFATEFGVKMVELGFGELSLSRIFAHAKQKNVVSINVMKKIGMLYVGCIADEVEYEILSV
jgi:RimJ/RimL family protein N-acetyltransferase